MPGRSLAPLFCSPGPQSSGCCSHRGSGGGLGPGDSAILQEAAVCSGLGDLTALALCATIQGEVMTRDWLFSG